MCIRDRAKVERLLYRAVRLVALADVLALKLVRKLREQLVVCLLYTSFSGRRGRRPLQGGCGDVGFVVIRRRAGVEPRPYEGRRNVVGPVSYTHLR